MSINPIITFKAGMCEVDVSFLSCQQHLEDVLTFGWQVTSTPWKIKPQPQPGYIYLFSEDGSDIRGTYYLS
jgi:26S proteasome regulatory subunit N13